MAGPKEEKMGAAAVICTCNKRFKSEIDMAKHLLDSPRHAQDTATDELHIIAKSPPPPLPSQSSEPLRTSTPPAMPPLASISTSGLTKALEDFEKLVERLSLPKLEKDQSCDSIVSSDREILRDISPNVPSNNPSSSTSRPEETTPLVGEDTYPVEEPKKYWDARKKANVSMRELRRVIDNDSGFEVVTKLETTTEKDILEEDWVICERGCTCCGDCSAGII